MKFKNLSIIFIICTLFLCSCNSDYMAYQQVSANNIDEKQIDVNEDNANDQENEIQLCISDSTVISTDSSEDDLYLDWSTEDQDIIEIVPDGYSCTVLALKEGKAVLSLTKNDIIYNFVIVVSDSGLQAESKNIHIDLNQTNSYTLDIPKDALDKDRACIFMSGTDNTKLKDGIVTFDGPGLCEIYVKAGSSDSAKICIKADYGNMQGEDIFLFTNQASETFDDCTVLKGNAVSTDTHSFFAQKQGTSRVSAVINGSKKIFNIHVMNEKTNEIFDFASNSSPVDFYGRNYISNDMVVINNSAAGFVASFLGTELKGNICVSRSLYMRVCIDGKTIDNGLTLFKNGSCTIISGLEYGFHTVKILKCSEASQNSFGLKSLSTDGLFVENEYYSNKYIVAYGDSISTGTADIKVTGKGDYNAVTDGTRTYIQCAAAMLGYNTDIFAKSGIGLYNSYGDTDFCIKNLWKTCSPLYSDGFDNDIPLYNINSFTPDIIIINLGSNDVDSYNYTEQDYIDECCGFIDELNTAYKNESKIILCCNAMISDINDATKQICNMYDNVYLFEMTRAVNSHPSLDEHLKNGLRLATLIDTIENQHTVD